MSYSALSCPLARKRRLQEAESEQPASKRKSHPLKLAMDEGFNVESEGSGEETELREDEEEDEEQAKQKASDQECEEEEQAKRNTESANTEEEDDDEGEWSKMARKIWICLTVLFWVVNTVIFIHRLVIRSVTEVTAIHF